MDFVIAEPACAGPLNFTAPQDMTQGEFAHALAASLRRPQWMSVPAVILRTALGDFADLFLAGQRAPPTRLLAMGFRFSRPGPAERPETRDGARALARAPPDPAGRLAAGQTTTLRYRCQLA